METGQNGTLDLNLVWHSSEARIALVPTVSVKDRPLHWIIVRSQTYYPKHILAYDSGKARYALVVGSGSFLDRLIRGGDGGGLSTTLRPGLKCGCLESKFGRGPGPLDRSGMGWSRLCLGYERACVSRYPAVIHWFANRCFYEMVRLGYGLAP